MIARSFKATLMAVVVAMCAIVIGGVMDTPEIAEARKGGGGYGKKIVKKAKRYAGTPYGHGGGAMVCTELTSNAVGGATGIYMETTPAAQKRYGYQPRNIHRGDVVFFDENGPSGPPTHVAIYAGKGLIWHASSYFGEVVRSDIQYIRGYDGARRIRP